MLNRSLAVSSGCGAGGVGAELRLSASAEARKCRDVSFSSLFVHCTSPSQRVHLVDSVVQLSSSQDTHGILGDMYSCGSVHGGVMHDNSSGLHVNSCGALGTRIHVMYMLLKSRENKGTEHEYSAWGSVSCCRGACFSTAGTRKFAW